nr:oligosaccharyl transferase subunit ost3/OST6 [Polyrhizophydium stewartii]
MLAPWTWLLGALALLLAAGGPSPVAAVTLAKRVEKLNSLPDRHLPIPLTSDSFAVFTERPRNYTLFVLLTTSLPEHGQFGVQYRHVTKAWSRVFEPGKLYFSELDFKVGQEVFAKLGIQSVPLMFRFPPTEGPLAIQGQYDIYDFNRHGMEAQPFVEFVEAKTGVKIPYSKPVDYTNAIISGVLLASAIIAGYLFWDQITRVFHIPHLWLSGSWLMIVVMCGGYMWNTIRNPPFVGQHNGQAHLISGGFQYQFGVETFIVAGLYSVVSLSLLLLVAYVPTIKNVEEQRRITWVTVLVFVVTYSFTLNFFKVKIGNYPFRLLF